MIFIFLCLFSFFIDGKKISESSFYGATILPVTYLVLDLLNKNFYFLTFIVLTFCSGKILEDKAWLVSDQKVNRRPYWVFVFSKSFSFFFLIFFLLNLFFISGLIFQISQGYYNFNFSLYIKRLYIYEFLRYFNMASLAIFFHTFFGKKWAYVFVAFICFMNVFNSFMLEGRFLHWNITPGFIYFLANLFSHLILPLSENKLLAWNTTPQLVYSNMNGYGPFWLSHLMFRLYWAVLSFVLLASSFLFWRKKGSSLLKNRWLVFRQKFNSWEIVFSAFSFFVFLALEF